MRGAIRLLMLGALVVAATPMGAQDEGTIRTAVIVYGLDRVSEDAYQRILTAPRCSTSASSRSCPRGRCPS